jgi:hypothetical protein
MHMLLTPILYLPMAGTSKKFPASSTVFISVQNPLHHYIRSTIRVVTNSCFGFVGDQCMLCFRYHRWFQTTTLSSLYYCNVFLSLFSIYLFIVGVGLSDINSNYEIQFSFILWSRPYFVLQIVGCALTNDKRKWFKKKHIDSRKPRNTSLRIIDQVQNGTLAEDSVQDRNFPNTIWQYYCHTNLLDNGRYNVHYSSIQWHVTEENCCLLIN